MRAARCQPYAHEAELARAVACDSIDKCKRLLLRAVPGDFCGRHGCLRSLMFLSITMWGGGWTTPVCGAGSPVWRLNGDSLLTGTAYDEPALTHLDRAHNDAIGAQRLLELHLQLLLELAASHLGHVDAVDVRLAHSHGDPPILN